MTTSEETIQILRDTWGVPHILAETELGAIYGQGYAMAEDRLPAMMRAYRMAVGQMAEAFGAEWVEHDYQQHVWRHAEIARVRYRELPAGQRQVAEAFVAGVNECICRYPDRVPSWSLRLEPWHLVALGRYAVWWLVLEQAEAKLGDVGVQAHPGRGGSNAWAVSPHRSADGSVIVFLDPHQSWVELLWFECHLHGGPLHVYGFQVPGLPYVVIGHNEHIAWTWTAGGPHVADVYELALNPEDPLQYRYEGEWRPLRRELVSIRVGSLNDPTTIEREILASHHGPIVKVDGQKAYAFKLAYADVPFEDLEAHGRLNRATTLEEFQDVLAMRMWMPGNVMYGDTDGNIYYQRTGRVPIRPSGYDWSRSVPGDTSQAEWLGFHETADLVQVLNPPAGWLQNCNVHPEKVTEPNPVRADRYPAYVLSDPTERIDNPRGQRASMLLASIPHMTLEDAVQVAHDAYVYGATPWLMALFAAWEAHGPTCPYLADSIGALRAWDCRADQDSFGMTLYWAWWRAIPDGDALADRIYGDERLPDDVQQGLLRAIDEAGAWLRQHFGTLHVPWGTVYRARRGEESWPVSGGVGGRWATVALRNVRGYPDDSGIAYVDFGQSCTTIVMLKKGDVRSFSVVPYGQSDDPRSAHFADQGRELFSAGKLKDTWFARARLEGHVEARRSLRTDLGSSRFSR